MLLEQCLCGIDEFVRVRRVGIDVDFLRLELDARCPSAFGRSDSHLEPGRGNVDGRRVDGAYDAHRSRVDKETVYRIRWKTEDGLVHFIRAGGKRA